MGNGDFKPGPGGIPQVCPSPHPAELVVLALQNPSLGDAMQGGWATWFNVWGSGLSVARVYRFGVYGTSGLDVIDCWGNPGLPNDGFWKALAA